MKFSDQNFAFALNASVVIGYGALVGVESLDECERSAGALADPMESHAVPIAGSTRSHKL